jgi:hypothetical protein
MAAYTDSLGFTKGTAAFLAKHNTAVSVISVDLDFAAIKAARTDAGSPALASTDTLQVLPIPAGALVLAVGIDVTKAEGATATVGIGDAGSATRYVTGGNLNSVANTASALSAPFLSAAASNITLTFNHNDIDTAVARVYAVIINTTN